MGIPFGNKCGEDTLFQARTLQHKNSKFIKNGKENFIYCMSGYHHC